MAQIQGMTDFQFNKHLADTLMLLELARKEIIPFPAQKLCLFARIFVQVQGSRNRAHPKVRKAFC